MEKIVLGIFLCISWTVGATEYRLENIISVVGAQATRPVYPAADNRIFINFPTGSAWTEYGGSGGVICGAGSAVLPPNDPKMLALAVAALTIRATVTVIVDNSLPKIGPYCQVTNLDMRGS